ncbi:hypothetical protein IWQ55_006647 [Labrenzia sp. EL_208]|nr:hypothetical protein [Labrenzia sp. EL_132]MBG6233405.1 hypothetical protein [Labrenzia sp. EL_208]
MNCAISRSWLRPIVRSASVIIFCVGVFFPHSAIGLSGETPLETPRSDECGHYSGDIHSGCGVRALAAFPCSIHYCLTIKNIKEMRPNGRSPLSECKFPIIDKIFKKKDSVNEREFKKTSLLIFSSADSEGIVMSTTDVNIADRNDSVIVVSTLSELNDAISNASGGEEIVMTEGNYGSLSLKNLVFSSEVTLRAEVGTKVVINELFVTNSANITFDSVSFEYVPDHNAYVSEKPFQILNSSGITIENSIFATELASSDDPIADGFGTGIGLAVMGSDDVTVHNNEFFNWYRGAYFNESNGLTVTNNDVHDIRSDGFNFAGVSDVLIEGNYIHDFAISEESPDHADFIQFWTTGTKTPTTNIVIRENVLATEEGDPAQGLFMRNEEVDNGRAGEEMFYQNIVIEDNLISAEQPHGIYVGQAHGVVVDGNILIDSAEGLKNWVPAIRVNQGSTGVEVSNNTAHRIVIDQGSSEFIVSDNNIVQNISSELAGYFGSQEFDLLKNELLSKYTKTAENTSGLADEVNKLLKEEDIETNEATLVRIANTSNDDVFDATEATERFSFQGELVSNGEFDVIVGVDFEAGDTLGFSGYSAGFFDADVSQFVNVFDSGRGAIVGSISELIELAKSGNVKLTKSSSGSVQLEIGVDTKHTIVLEGVSYEKLGSASDSEHEDGSTFAGLDLEADTWFLVEGDDNDNRLSNTSDKDIFIGGEGADRFSFHGKRVSSNDQNVITDLNFEEGDSIGFSSFDKEFFDSASNFSFKSGAGAIIDSEEDLFAFASLENVQTYTTGRNSMVFELQAEELLSIEIEMSGFDLFA